MRPNLSATATYNYNLAKWLEQKTEATFSKLMSIQSLMPLLPLMKFVLAL